MKSICAGCGESMDKGQGAYCGTCRPARDHKQDERRRRSRDGNLTTTQRGYGWHWQQLSARAIKLQPFCADCGSEHDLTTDHTVRAWQRVEAGKTVRLRDVEVVCRRCNSERGAARGEKATDDYRQTHREGG